MEPITAVAATIVTLIFSEAAKEGGKSLGTGAAKLMSQLITTVRNKFKASGIESLVTSVEKQPTEANVNSVQAVLVAQMEGDREFATQLQELLAQLEAAGTVRQVMASGIEVAGDLEAGDMSQKSSHSSSINQEMLTNVKAQNIRLGNLRQES